MKLIGSEAAYIIDNVRISQNAIFMHRKEMREFKLSVRNTKYLVCSWLPQKWIDWLLWKLKGDLANEDNSAGRGRRGRSANTSGRRRSPDFTAQVN